MSYQEMQSRIDDCNYMRDPRTQPPADVPTVEKVIQCETCNGKISPLMAHYETIRSTAYSGQNKPHLEAEDRAGAYRAERVAFFWVSKLCCDECGGYGEYDGEISLPWIWGVCSVCEGKGTHVNPSIDAGGLSAEDFADDPDFAEDYRSGVFDQRCNRCDGKRVIPVVDMERVTVEDLKAYRDALDALDAYRAEALAERRMGA